MNPHKPAVYRKKNGQWRAVGLGWVVVVVGGNRRPTALIIGVRVGEGLVELLIKQAHPREEPRSALRAVERYLVQRRVLGSHVPRVRIRR